MQCFLGCAAEEFFPRPFGSMVTLACRSTVNRGSGSNWSVEPRGFGGSGQEEAPLASMCAKSCFASFLCSSGKLTALCMCLGFVQGSETTLQSTYSDTSAQPTCDYGKCGPRGSSGSFAVTLSCCAKPRIRWCSGLFICQCLPVGWPWS